MYQHKTEASFQPSPVDFTIKQVSVLCYIHSEFNARSNDHFQGNLGVNAHINAHFGLKNIYIMRSHVATHVFQSFFRLYVHNIRPLNARWKLYQFNFDQSETRVPAGRWQQFQNTELYPCSKTITSWKYALHGNMFKKFNKKAGTKLIMEEILIIVVCAWPEFHETFPQYPNL